MAVIEVEYVIDPKNQLTINEEAFGNDFFMFISMGCTYFQKFISQVLH